MKTGVPVLTSQSGNTPIQGNLSVWGSLGISGTDITPGARWLGNRDGAAPTTGTFKAGDWVIDKTTPAVWVCTTGGTPGTWQSLTAAKITTYNGVTTLGWGVPAIYGYLRPAQQVNATVTLATYTVGVADGSFQVSANVNVTVSTTVTMTVTCSYTDETGAARVLTLPFILLAGTVVASITTLQGNVPYEGVPVHLRAKAGTTITLATAGTTTTCTYTAEGQISQIA